MKVSEAKEKICPFMSQNCICGDCMAWQYTKDKIYEDTHSFSWGDIVEEKHIKLVKKGYTISYSDDFMCDYSRATDLNEDNKEGYCKRLENEQRTN